MVAVFQIKEIRSAAALRRVFQLIKQSAAIQTGHIPVVLRNDNSHRHIHRICGQRRHQGRGGRYKARNSQDLRPGGDFKNVISRPGVSHQDHPVQIALTLQVTGEDPRLPRNGRSSRALCCSTTWTVRSQPLGSPFSKE